MGALALCAAVDGRHTAAAVGRMLDAAPHRGTAAAVATVGGVSVGVARRDPSDDAWLAQHDGAACAVNGALDNAGELAAELRRRRRPPAGDDPADVLLAAFAEWGPGAAPRLRGPLVAAWTDGRRSVVVRDQLGLRTCFMRAADGAVLAASEAKQVAAGAGRRREPDVDALTAIFYGRLEERQTAVRGVERLPKAHVASVDGDRVRLHAYWDPSNLLETSPLGVADARERFTQLFDQAVRRAVTGNDAVSLSGGVDSPAVAAYAAPHHLQRTGRPLHALSAVYPDFPSVDERPYIELVADHLGMPLHAYVPSARPLDDVTRWTDLLDGPVDTLSIPEVAENYRHAAALGVRTVLTGEMAEYVFEMHPHTLGHLLAHGRLRPAGRWIRAMRRRGRSWGRIARHVAPSVAPAALASRWARWRDREARPLPPWIDVNEVGGRGHRPDLERPASQRWLANQLAPFRGPGTGIEADDLCAASLGITVRMPFADVDLWEFFLSLRAETKFPAPGRKVLVRGALRGRVPDAILDRRDKTVFDEHGAAMTDYDALATLLRDPPARIPGVDYRGLLTRIERRDMDVFEAGWANDIACVHAFLALER